MTPSERTGAPTGTELAGLPVEERAARLDRWLADLLPPGEGYALTAVGSLGRGELPPYPDLDLVLVHDGRPGIAAVADAVWYPIWDGKFPLDHAVRTVDEAVRIADADVKAALGLLDARHVAGDPALAARLRAAAVGAWQAAAGKRLAALREVTEARWAERGELAFLLEGDLKEARGGLRDVVALRGLGYAHVADVFRPTVRLAADRLRAVREAVHQVSGRRQDRLLAELRDPVAARLGLGDGADARDVLLRQVSEDARTVAYAADDGWRAVDRWRVRRRRPAPRRPLADGVVAADGEVRLARAATAPEYAGDPALSLRVAAAAATARLPIARGTLDWLSRHTPALPDVWPASARQAFLTLLGSGPALVDVWEACDRYGLVSRWLPDWARVRSLPQYDPVHRYTVDRHLVQAAAETAASARDVHRPDLLALGAFLHDIGKGLGAPDHAVEGVGPARAICARLGLPAEDTRVIGTLVRYHLLLPDLATRRDLADPATVAAVAEAVDDPDTLDLLYALVRADAAATGPAAWSEWKGQLVAELVARTRRVLADGELVPVAPPDPADFAGDPLPVVTVTDGGVRVLAPDRPGLLAAVAGCLALHRLEVLAADAAVYDGRALLDCEARPRYGGAPDRALLAADLRRAVAGTLPLDRLHAAQPAGEVRLVWCHDATDATVLEVRAADAPGLLHQVALALGSAGADVRAARVATLGTAVVDAFYLVGGYDRAEVERAVRGALC